MNIKYTFLSIARIYKDIRNMSVRLIYIPESLTSETGIFQTVLRASTQSIYSFIVDNFACRVLRIRDNRLSLTSAGSGFPVAEKRYSVGGVSSREENEFHENAAREDLVLTCHFSRHPRNGKRDDYASMRRWHLSIIRRNLTVVVFHDHFTRAFESTFSERVRFVRVRRDARDTNDDRLARYLRYLELAPRVRYAVLADVSDVRLVANVFSDMAELDRSTGLRHLYVGHAEVHGEVVGSPIWMRRCFGSGYNQTQEKTRVLNGLNACVVGGARRSLLPVLRELVSVMRRLPTTLNLNKATLNHVVHERFKDVVFTKYPPTSSFLEGEISARDVSIKRK